MNQKIHPSTRVSDLAKAYGYSKSIFFLLSISTLLLLCLEPLSASAKIQPENGMLRISTQGGEDPLAVMRACVPETGQPDYDSRIFLLKNNGDTPVVLEGLDLALGDYSTWSLHGLRADVLSPGESSFISVAFFPKSEQRYSDQVYLNVRSGGKMGPILAQYQIPLNGDGFNCGPDGLPPIDDYADDTGDEDESHGDDSSEEANQDQDSDYEEADPEIPGDNEEDTDETNEDEESGDENDDSAANFGLGLSGTVPGPCPDGVKTLALILQFDDANGFDYLASRLSAAYEAFGQRTPNLDVKVKILKPQLGQMRKKGSRNFNPSVFKQSIIDAVKGLDCECSDAVITVLGHGKAKKGEEHRVVYKDRYKSPNGGYILHKEKLLWTNILQWILKAFHDAEKDCIRIQFMLSECYSGAAFGDIERTREKSAPGRRADSITGISGANKKQKCFGQTDIDKDGNPAANVYFIDAVIHCLREHRSIAAAWECISKHTRDSARSGSSRKQDPQRYP